MRYGQYFEKIEELYDYDITGAEKLLREAENLASQHIQNHLILCATSWQNIFNNNDNAMRCLLESECRTNDCRGFIEIAFCHIEIMNNLTIAQRCFKKATEIAKEPEDFMRLEEVFIRFNQTELAEYCRKQYANILDN